MDIRNLALGYCSSKTIECRNAERSNGVVTGRQYFGISNILGGRRRLVVARGPRHERRRASSRNTQDLSRESRVLSPAILCRPNGCQLSCRTKVSKFPLKQRIQSKELLLLLCCPLLE